MHKGWRFEKPPKLFGANKGQSSNGLKEPSEQFLSPNLAKAKPTVAIAEMALPIEVRLPLRVIEPHITSIGIAVERTASGFSHVHRIWSEVVVQPWVVFADSKGYVRSGEAKAIFQSPFHCLGIAFAAFRPVE
jgi:hypothetical protein